MNIDKRLQPTADASVWAQPVLDALRPEGPLMRLARDADRVLGEQARQAAMGRSDLQRVLARVAR